MNQQRSSQNLQPLPIPMTEEEILSRYHGILRPHHVNGSSNPHLQQNIGQIPPQNVLTQQIPANTQNVPSASTSKISPPQIQDSSNSRQSRPVRRIRSAYSTFESKSLIKKYYNTSIMRKEKKSLIISNFLVKLELIEKYDNVFIKNCTFVRKKNYSSRVKKFEIFGYRLDEFHLFKAEVVGISNSYIENTRIEGISEFLLENSTVKLSVNSLFVESLDTVNVENTDKQPKNSRKRPYESDQLNSSGRKISQTKPILCFIPQKIICYKYCLTGTYEIDTTSKYLNKKQQVFLSKFDSCKFNHFNLEISIVTNFKLQMRNCTGRFRIYCECLDKEFKLEAKEGSFLDMCFVPNQNQGAVNGEESADETRLAVDGRLQIKYSGMVPVKDQLEEYSGDAIQNLPNESNSQ